MPPLHTPGYTPPGIYALPASFCRWCPSGHACWLPCYGRYYGRVYTAGCDNVHFCPRVLREEGWGSQTSRKGQNEQKRREIEVYTLYMSLPEPFWQFWALLSLPNELPPFNTLGEESRVSLIIPGLIGVLSRVYSLLVWLFPGLGEVSRQKGAHPWGYTRGFWSKLLKVDKTVDLQFVSEK